MMDGNGQTIFVTVKQLATETGLPRNQIVKDIHSGKLPAMKRGKSYYIYSTEASQYIINLAMESRGIPQNKYDFVKNIDPLEFSKLMMEVMVNDKSKDKS